MNITGMSEQWVTARIKQKGESKCIPWKSLQELILAYPNARKKVDVFALSIYGLRVTPVLAILAETFRSLNACRRAGEGRFIGCNLHDEDIEWRAPWLLPDEILYWCGNFDWIPLLGIWGAIGYAPLMVLRQYRSRQWLQKEDSRDNHAWDQTRWMMRLAIGPMMTPEYNEWWVRRINDNIPRPIKGDSQSLEEHL
ncbi:hypothetical protein Goari_026905, partial [Gossypium aridum]|nr:hypothetical protein [Gossypium aridum]